MSKEQNNKVTSNTEKDTSAMIAQPAGGTDQGNDQPSSVQDRRPGYGDKKLEGPNRPST